MDIEEIKEFNGHAVTDEQFDEIIKSEFTDDVENNGQTPMYPALTWYIIKLIDGTEVNLFN